VNIILFGATGMIGSRIASELEQRGHAVTAATRANGSDVTEPSSVSALAAGADAVVSAVSARGVDYMLTDIASSLVEALRQAEVRRLVIVGGAGSLEVAPGKRLVDTPEFRDEWKPEALQHADSLEYYRTVGDLDWTYLSPAALIRPGKRTEAYRKSGDTLLVDDSGHSEISAEDYAIAVADLLEQDSHHRERVSVAW
jgi:uncharacterized protein